MEFISINASDEKNVKRLSDMAREIVKDFYDPLLGPEQNDYMIELFQSVPGIMRQFGSGYRYYIASEDGRDIGFFGFYPREDALYLSKFYLYKQERGRGFGRQIVSFLSEEAKKEGLAAIELNVNKYNPSIAAYEKMGFVRIRSEVNDIGHGYVMDDYVYRLDI